MIRCKLTFMGCTLACNHYRIMSPDLVALLRKQEVVPVYRYGEVTGSASMEGNELIITIGNMVVYRFRRYLLDRLIRGIVPVISGRMEPCT